ncbi:helix-turn-helix domain-containing protein [Micromonospora craniellae]|uniref:XRE family transcriptional regulator n=1 Tax=Micromonospora craniellae TaxID=2294034 RepID=A0A372FTB1_9ACTN|nr:helix-turn-helix transcriptional regulator [Micromonospora craniellae]QOC93640.1 helix-turn-helix transcriptional regulator [Micromonospora craniellae]RFS43963.1 XRE family transcriptional regulator [Micromonospora craniellae]
MNHALRAAMAEAGVTAEQLAAQTGVDPKTASRWISPGRVPQPRRRSTIASMLGRDVGDLWPDVLKRSEPQWLRDWVDWEREAVAIRWFEHCWVPGLLQTEAYARATLADEALTPSEVDNLVASRMNRQAILRRERPPLLVAVIHEHVLYQSAYGDRSLMREQCEHLAACAELPHVKVLIVPRDLGMYPGLGGGFIIVELPDGEHVAHVDSQGPAQIVKDAASVATLSGRWERISSEALSRPQSLDLIRKAAGSWT